MESLVYGYRAGQFILGAGIYQLSHPPDTVLSHLHATIWWGALMLVMGFSRCTSTSTAREIISGFIKQPPNHIFQSAEETGTAKKSDAPKLTGADSAGFRPARWPVAQQVHPGVDSESKNDACGDRSGATAMVFMDDLREKPAFQIRC